MNPATVERGDRMGRIATSRRGWWAMALLATGLAASFSAGVVADDDALRARMRSALETLTRILPLSLAPKSYASAPDRAAISAGLDSLAADADAIERHAEAYSATHRILSNVFGAEMSRLQRDLEAERYENVRRGLLGVTRTCYTCHSKLPGGADLDLGAELMQAAQVQALPLYHRAVLAGAVRRFDEALEYYEALFRAAPMDSQAFSWASALERYLLLALRVRRDAQRPAAVLRSFSARDAVPPYLKRYVERWIAALDQLELDAPEGEELQRARALRARAESAGAYPADPAAKVYYVAMSGLLHVYLRREDRTPRERSQAWYLLGVAEYHLTSTYWTGQTEYFLERAILAAPGTVEAERAYEFLEDYLILEYSGSAGLAVPPEASSWLRELRRRAGHRAP